MHGWSSGMAALVVALVLLAARPAGSAVIQVPQQITVIQRAVDAAQNGDTVLVAPGTYPGGLVISGKSVTLASRFIFTGNPADVTQTVIEGGDPILTIAANAGAATTVRGLTFLNGGYHIVNHAREVAILDNRFLGGGDQISFEGAGGVVRNCYFENAGDDGIDADDASDPIIELNTILNAGDDGIEIRLHSHNGSMLEILIQDNLISGCGEDGIQLIDYPGASSRHFRIERNVLANNAMAGLGSMPDGNTEEDFGGAPMVERVEVIGNTFSGNPHGLTGGDNMLVMNNIFAASAQVGVKRVAGSSLVTYNLFWSNGTDHTGSNVDAGTTLQQDPMLEPDYDLEPGSPCIDAGAVSVLWNGAQVMAPPYRGPAPDLGARESGGTVSVAPAARGELALAIVGNPSRAGFAVSFTLGDDAPARIEVLDLMGRRLVTRDLVGVGRMSQVLELPETRGLPAGVYVVRLSQGGRSRVTRGVVLR